MEKILYKNKEYSDCIYSKQNIKLSFRAKLLILFSSYVEADIKIYTENAVGDCTSEVVLNTYSKKLWKKK